jgi:hypothetical protein
VTGPQGGGHQPDRQMLLDGDSFRSRSRDTSSQATVLRALNVRANELVDRAIDAALDGDADLTAALVLDAESVLAEACDLGRAA